MLLKTQKATRFEALAHQIPLHGKDASLAARIMYSLLSNIHEGQPHVEMCKNKELPLLFL